MADLGVIIAKRVYYTNQIKNIYILCRRNKSTCTADSRRSQKSMPYPVSSALKILTSAYKAFVGNTVTNKLQGVNSEIKK